MSAPAALRCQRCLAAGIFDLGAEHECTGVTSHAHADGGITQIRVTDCPCPCQALPTAGEVVLICCRCQAGIGPGEEYERHDHDRPTAAPFITFSHAGGCP